MLNIPGEKMDKVKYQMADRSMCQLGLDYNNQFFN